MLPIGRIYAYPCLYSLTAPAHFCHALMSRAIVWAHDTLYTVNDWVVEKVRHDHVTKCKQEKAWARGQHEAFPTMDHVADHRLHDHHSFMAIQVDPSY